MATKTKKASKKTAKAPAATKEKVARVREPFTPIETATFDLDDKRAQYARLVVFNYAMKNQKALKVSVPKDADVNTVDQSVLTKAAVALANGNELQGSEGLELISSLSKKGATDTKVAERGLTKAYAAEVRPFLRRGRLAPQFARRAGAGKKAQAKSAPAEETSE